MKGVWKHKETGALYTLIGVANEGATRPGWSPLTAVYLDSSGWLLTRPLSEWAERYEVVA